MRGVLAAILVMVFSQTAWADEVFLKCAVNGEVTFHNFEKLSEKKERVNKTHNITLLIDGSNVGIKNTSSGGTFFYRDECKLSPNNVKCRSEDSKGWSTFNLSRKTGSGTFVSDRAPLELWLTQNTLNYDCVKVAAKNLF